MVSLGVSFRLDRARFLRVREKTEGRRSAGLRPGSHDLSLFRFQHHASCRNWDRAYGCSLLRQNLNSAECRGVTATLEIREILRDEYELLGQLMVNVYSTLDGFPAPSEQPGYYEMLANIGSFNDEKDTKVLVAISAAGELVGGVVYFADMARYGSGGTATSEKNASGIRLLGVDPESRGAGVGKALTNACIQLARDSGHAQVVLHTTQAMQIAWELYVKLGFERSPDLDFTQEELPVFGFRLRLDKGS